MIFVTMKYYVSSAQLWIGVIPIRHHAFKTFKSCNLDQKVSRSNYDAGDIGRP